MSAKVGDRLQVGWDTDALPNGTIVECTGLADHSGWKAHKAHLIGKKFKTYFGHFKPLEPMYLTDDPEGEDPFYPIYFNGTVKIVEVPNE